MKEYENLKQLIEEQLDNYKNNSINENIVELLDIKMAILKDDKEKETKLINEGFKKYNIILGGKDNE